MDKITPQKVFDKAWQHFIVEKNPPAVVVRSLNIHTLEYVCAYQTPDGNKCPIGLCIPDGHPANKSILHVGNLCREYPDLFEVEARDDLFELQWLLHDSLMCISTGEWGVSFEEMKDKYIEAANRFGLTIPGQ